MSGGEIAGYLTPGGAATNKLQTNSTSETVEEGQIADEFARIARRKRSFSAQPPSTVKYTLRSRRRRKSVSPSPMHRNKYNRSSRSRSRSRDRGCRKYWQSELTATRNGYHFGVNIPGKIVAIHNKIGWIYSNYKSRNQCYQFNTNNIPISINTSLLDTDQKVYFNHDNMFVSNIRPTISFSYSQIKSYLTIDGLSNHSNDIYIFNTKINCHEDIHTEFKRCRNGFQYDLLMKYLNAFVNSDGGTIYFGINDDGIIKGVQYYNNKKIDKLLRNVDGQLKKWEPKKYYNILKRSVKIKFIKIIQYDDVNKIGYIIPNSYVIKCSISTISGENNQITFTDSYTNSYFKLQASIEKNQPFDSLLKQHANY